MMAGRQGLSEGRGNAVGLALAQYRKREVGRVRESKPDFSGPSGWTVGVGDA
jgi:hypothetical protein